MGSGWRIWSRREGVLELCRVVASRWDRRRRFGIPPPPPRPPSYKAKELRSFVEGFKGEGEQPIGNAESVVSLCQGLDSKSETSEFLRSWIDQGNVLSRDVAAAVSSWFVHCKHHVQATKFMSLVREQNLVEMTPKLYSLEISHLCQHLGPSKGESLYLSIPESLRTEDVTTAFLTAVAKQDDSAKAEKWMQELGTGVSIDAWNAFLQMYLRKDRHDKLRKTYYSFKDRGLKPVLYTYWLVLQCRERIGGFDEVEMEFDAELKRTNLDNADIRLLTLILRSYALLGKRKMVDRIWNLIISGEVAAPDVNSYITAIKSFGLFGDLDKAYALLEETKTKFKRIPPNSYVWIVEICVRLKMMDQAEKVMAAHIEKTYFYPYNFIVTGYVETLQVGKALMKLDEGFDAIPFRNRKLVYKTVMALLPVFAKRRDIHSAEKLMANYGSNGDVRVYNALLGVYLSAKRMPTAFLERMKNHNIEPDEETARMMDTLQTFWNEQPPRGGSIWKVDDKGRRIPRDEQMAHIKFSRDEKKIRRL